MFDILPKALASVASFLFPLFASYKALNTADPAQLTPWLMYWVVLACALLVESWTEWLLVWIPFYYYFRLLFLLYLVLPQTQGARILYQTRLHPWIAEHETRIDEFIGSAHARMRSAGMHYLKQAIAYLRTVLGLPAPEADESAAAAAGAVPSASAQSYTQSLLARFTLPSARWPGGAMGAAAAAVSNYGTGTSDPAVPTTGGDFYNLVAGAFGALGTAATGAAASAMSTTARGATAAMSPADRASFLTTQLDRMRALTSALEREAAQLKTESGGGNEDETSSSPLSRPLSGASGLSKSRSEPDLVMIDAESGTEEEEKSARRRHGAPGAGGSAPRDASSTANPSAGGSWIPWSWGSGGGGAAAAGADGSTPAGDEAGKSSSVEK